MNKEEFHVEANGEQVTCTLASPDESTISYDSALLLNISATANLALHDEMQATPTQPHLDAGHYVLT